MPTLAILICTLPERYDKLKRLRRILDPQISNFSNVSLYINDAGRGMPTGTKRNHLIEQSGSDYFVFIDDDDIISDQYVLEIVKQMEYDPDVITFNGYMTTNGSNRQNFTIKLGSDYVTKDNHHYRWPNHLAVMRREKVREVKFKDIWIGEDYQWSKEIHDKKLLKTGIHIEKDLYHYDCITRTKGLSIIERRNRLKR
jgi:glycosyltransferase involved in cell wall biosynthesis